MTPSTHATWKTPPPRGGLRAGDDTRKELEVRGESLRKKAVSVDDVSFYLSPRRTDPNLRRTYSYVIYIIYIQASKSVFVDTCICSGVKGASTNSYEDIHGDEEKQRRGGPGTCETW
jgi:hypothetical protein